MNELEIRTTKPSDASTLLAIYAYYVKETAITFEYAVPTLSDFRQRIETTLETYPFLVALKAGEIVGFAYAGPFNHREAYKWSVEVTIYLDPNKRRLGAGKKLYQALEAKLKAQGIQNINACISVPNKEDEHLNYDSMHFHEHLGYRLVGRFHACGYKFETWYDMIWMEKFIGEHSVPAPKFISFAEMSEK